MLELGPGTGIFTRALLGRGLPQDELILVECDPLFAGLLKHGYPDARIYQDAFCMEAREREADRLAEQLRKAGVV